jgi:hypothetical protein
VRHIPLAAILAASMLVLLACQSQPVKLLTDPKEILATAALTTASAKSVHVDLTVDGPIRIDLLGTTSGALDLKGTTAALDVDLAGNKLHATFASPQLMSLVGELIALDGTAYLKSSFTGPKYLSQPVASPAAASPVPSANPLAGISELLARSDLKPVKGDDVPCAGGTCYTVTLHLTAAELAALGGSGTTGGGPLPSIPALPGLPTAGLEDASADLVILVEQASTRLSGIDAKLDLGDTGTPHIVATFTKWNEPVTVTAPPSDQVQPAP